MNGGPQVILEHGNDEEYRLKNLERSARDESSTPQWNDLVAWLIEGATKNGTIFVEGFVKSLLPSLVISVLCVLKATGDGEKMRR